MKARSDSLKPPRQKSGRCWPFGGQGLDLVDRSIDFIRGANGQWGSLTGDIVATGAQGKSVNLIIDQGEVGKTKLQVRAGHAGLCYRPASRAC